MPEDPALLDMLFAASSRFPGRAFNEKDDLIYAIVKKRDEARACPMRELAP